MKFLISQDKANHFVYGVIVFTVLFTIMNPWWALATTIVVGAGKEIYDKVSKTGTPDPVDAFVTGFGGFICFLNATAWHVLRG